MEKRCKEICTCLTGSTDPEDLKRQAYRVIECSFYNRKTAPSFLYHCYPPDKAGYKVKNEKECTESEKKCMSCCKTIIPDAKRKVTRPCLSSFPIPSYKTFRCDAQGNNCVEQRCGGVRKFAGVGAKAAGSGGGGAEVATMPGRPKPDTDPSFSGSGDASRKAPPTPPKPPKLPYREVPKIRLSSDIERDFVLKDKAACLTKEAGKLVCPARLVRNCAGECEEDVIKRSQQERCKDTCPHEIVPLKKRQVYAKCGGMLPGYGGHVPGYSICTLGGAYSLETEDCLKRVISETRLNSMVKKCKIKDCKIIFVVGGPGSGKGTQCDMLKKTFDLTHLSSGDLLRDEVASGSSLGKSLQAAMTRGELVTMETVLHLLETAILKALAEGTKGFLVDGYPREVDQGLAFARKIRDCDVVLYFDAKDETMTKRLLHRAKTSGRADDNYETIRLRLKTFHSQTKPVVAHYNKLGKLIHVDAERNPDIVFREIECHLRKRGF